MLIHVGDSHSELRKDPISEDWVVIAPLRSGKPEELSNKELPRIPSAVATCPFEDPQRHGNDAPILRYGSTEDWSLQIIPNKYPAFVHNQTCASPMHRGLYEILPAIGHHDIIITRSHTKNFSELDPAQAQEVLCAFRDYYKKLAKDECVVYVSMFQNWGLKAGASVYHPHYQVMAIPIIPTNVARSLHGSSRYHDTHQTCVHCAIIQSEQNDKSRIIYENESVIAFCPFVSRSAFEIKIFPKHHLPYFEDTSDEDLGFISDALQRSLHMLTKTLDPDYNFFIHTAPIKSKADYSHYHWHIEILPKLNVMAGFEFGTGIDINPVDPNKASELLLGKI